MVSTALVLAIRTWSTPGNEPAVGMEQSALQRTAIEEPTAFVESATHAPTASEEPTTCVEPAALGQAPSKFSETRTSFRR
jgi:hypothetical protein